MLAIFFTIEHEQVLRTDLNNSEIRYTKKYVFSWQGVCVYTPYSLCMSTPLSTWQTDGRTNEQT